VRSWNITFPSLTKLLKALPKESFKGYTADFTGEKHISENSPTHLN